MLLILRSLQDAHAHVDQVYQPTEFSVDSETFELVSPVHLKFDIDKLGNAGRYRLTGTVRGTLGLACGRCLEPFMFPVEAAFDLQYLPHRKIRGRQRELDEEDLTTAYYSDDSIDLGHMMTEQFHL